MPFDWIHTKPAPSVPGRFRDQFVRSIQERALLLCNLGCGYEAAVRRIQASLNWEFDTSVGNTKRPSFYDEVPGLVAAMYEYSGQKVSKKKSGSRGKGRSTKARRKS